mmetsp:Transcript_35014/g.108056  ORF Transcript_35014/g.108056 Transcript_35014/m.108056 type:complete len:204 (+) Transcript_35014:56-667(+)
MARSPCGSRPPREIRRSSRRRCLPPRRRRLRELIIPRWRACAFFLFCYCSLLSMRRGTGRPNARTPSCDLTFLPRLRAAKTPAWKPSPEPRRHRSDDARRQQWWDVHSALARGCAHLVGLLGLEGTVLFFTLILCALGEPIVRDVRLQLISPRVLALVTCFHRRRPQVATNAEGRCANEAHRMCHGFHLEQPPFRKNTAVVVL